MRSSNTPTITVYDSSDTSKVLVPTFTPTAGVLYNFDLMFQTALNIVLSPPSGAHLLSAMADVGAFRHDDFHVSPPQGQFLSPADSKRRFAMSNVGWRVLIVLLCAEIVRLDETILGEVGFTSSGVIEELFVLVIGKGVQQLLRQQQRLGKIPEVDAPFDSFLAETFIHGGLIVKVETRMKESVGYVHVP